MGSLGSSDSTQNSKSNGHASEHEASPSPLFKSLLAEKINGVSRSESAKRKIKNAEKMKPKIVTANGGYVLEDVPHFSDYIPELPVPLFSFSLSLSLSHACAHTHTHTFEHACSFPMFFSIYVYEQILSKFDFFHIFVGFKFIVYFTNER